MAHLEQGRLVRRLDQRREADLQYAAVDRRVAEVVMPVEDDGRGGAATERGRDLGAVTHVARVLEPGSARDGLPRDRGEVGEQKGGFIAPGVDLRMLLRPAAA